jgi:D-sedoheptulose 7-phosphate isomerase
MKTDIDSIVEDSISVKREFFSRNKVDIQKVSDLIAQTFKSGGKLLLCGNGGSSTDAQHIAGEFVNRFINTTRSGLPAIALSTDGGIITSISNDTGFENIFARQIEALGRPNDCLLLISTSGTSLNVVKAAEKARQLNIKVIGLLGRDGGRVSEYCDLKLVVRSDNTQRIQEAHNITGHIICELVENSLFSD